MVDTEYRYELKFIISDQAAELLKQQLRALMELDSHSISDECSYTIRSLYFDDINSSAYYDKLDGDGVCLIEWPSQIEEILPRELIRITIEKNTQKGFDYRHITMSE